MIVVFGVRTDLTGVTIAIPLHQGSALSPLLLITVMDVISQELGRGPPHAMLFADDLVLCENTRKQAEEQLELWRKAIENKGLRVSRSKTEYLPPSSCHDSKVKVGEEEIKNVTVFKYLGSMFDAEGGSNTDCKKQSSTRLEQMERSNWSHM